MGDLRVHRAGVSTRSADGVELTGSAADLDGSARARALYELVERAATVESLASDPPARRGPFVESDAPALWRYARSNGIAVHSSAAAARERARAELGERDRVLRSWWGGLPPRRWDGRRGPALSALASLGSHDVHAFELPVEGASPFADVAVAGVLAFPRDDGAPFGLGFAARPEGSNAVEAAASEALQILAFLWEERVPDAPTPVGPTALHHVDYWQHPARHDALRAWLAGEHHARHHGAAELVERELGVERSADVELYDLTPAWAAPLHVARAVCRSALPLAFGLPPWTAGLPEALRVHPVG